MVEERVSAPIVIRTQCIVVLYQELVKRLILDPATAHQVFDLIFDLNAVSADQLRKFVDD